MCISTRLTCADEVAALPNHRNIPSTATILTNPLILIFSPFIYSTKRSPISGKTHCSLRRQTGPKNFRPSFRSSRLKTWLVKSQKWYIDVNLVTNQGGPRTSWDPHLRPGVISEIATESILYEKQLFVLRCKGFDLLVCRFINTRF